MFQRICRPFVVPAAVLALLLGTPVGPAVGQEGEPRKLAVELPAAAVASGSAAEVVLRLQDANNRPARAPKDLRVEVEVISPSGRREVERATIGAGQSATRLRVPLDEPGIATVRATQPQLLDGGSYISVVPPAGGRARSVGRPPGAGGTAAGGAPSVAAPTAEADPGATETAAIDAAAAPASPIEIEVRYAPQRDLLADGRDAVTIHAFIKRPDGGAPTDVAVRLFSDGGELSPPTLVIPAGAFVGTAALTSGHPGGVTVEAVNASPPADIMGARVLSVRFRAPVTSFELRPSPPEVSLLDASEVIAELRGPDGKPIATDEVRRVSLSLNHGQGGIEPLDIEIPVGRSVGRAAFLPSWLGAVTINGQSPDLLDRQTDIRVQLPLTLLIISAMGGLAGGLLAYLVHHRERAWRLFLGLVSGFVLYWMLLFLGLVELMPRAVALNPVTAFAVSIIGGWAGADVLAFATRRLGLGSGKQRRARGAKAADAA